MPETVGDCKPYLDYLDKEMTSLGVLSTFSVGFASLVLDRIVGNADKVTFFRTLWDQHIGAVLSASLMFLTAAWMFYKQRSDLGYYYGGIALSVAKPPAPDDWRLQNWLIESDSWNTWIFYRLGITTLIIGFLVYGQAIYESVYPSQPPRYWIAILSASFLIARLMYVVPALSIYRYDEHPYKACWLAIKTGTLADDWRSRGKQPIEPSQPGETLATNPPEEKMV
jgi:hypothetical protein